ncbi:cytochrome P450 [Gautieria morchelliformis]|nr:cytochrome P450 [Gautieria morchelliformis]
MACYLKVQRKAQKELDKVIGPDRLPELGDREKLPYIELICKEVYRWQQVDPTTFGHLPIKPDIHASGPSSLQAGKHQTSNMFHDKMAFGRDTDKFIPERFCGVSDCAHCTSGNESGMRICPHRYVADDQVFLAFASILHGFEINPKWDGIGDEEHDLPNLNLDITVRPEASGFLNGNAEDFLYVLRAL